MYVYAFTHYTLNYAKTIYEYINKNCYTYTNHNYMYFKHKYIEETTNINTATTPQNPNMNKHKLIGANHPHVVKLHSARHLVKQHGHPLLIWSS